MDRNDPAYEGQREYTPLFLRIYDPLILGVFVPVIWRCSASRLVDGYRRHVGHRHLDVGPGTGYFLARAGLPDASSVTLLDPNVNVLSHASRRLQNLDVTTIEADVLKPLPVNGPYDSAALNGVLHCLPGTDPEQGRGDRQRGRCPRTGRRPLRILDPRDLRATHLAGAADPRVQQPTGHLRQSRRHRGGPRRDPRGLVRAGRARDCRLDGHLRGRDPAHEVVDWQNLVTSRASFADPGQ